MKHCYLLALTLTLSIYSQTSLGEDIADTYTTGDTLTATKLNNIKSAVNSKQDRVTGTCSSGESIGTINADGSVVCEAGTDTLGALNCTTDQYAKFNGSSWECSGTTTKDYSLNINSTWPDSSTGTFLGNLGMTLPESGTNPRLIAKYTIPDDYLSGTSLRMEVLFITSAPAGTVALQPGSVWLFKRFGNYGEDLVTTGQLTASFSDSTETSGGTPTSVYAWTLDFNPQPGVFRRGDIFYLPIVRFQSSPGFDTSTSDVTIVGIRVIYTTTE